MRKIKITLAGSSRLSGAAIENWTAYTSDAIPGLAVHRQVGDPVYGDGFGLEPERYMAKKTWRISHIGSGRALLANTPLPTRRAALELATILAPICDWTHDASWFVGPEARTMQIMAKVRAADSHWKARQHRAEALG